MPPKKAQSGKKAPKPLRKKAPTAATKRKPKAKVKSAGKRGSANKKKARAGKAKSETGFVQFSLPALPAVPCRGFLRAPSALPPARPCPTGPPLLLPLLPVIRRRPPLRALPDAQFLAPLSPALPSSVIPCPGGF